MRMHPATDKEAQRGLDDTWPGDMVPDMKPLRMVTAIERNPNRPGWAKLTLACGHTEELDDFPAGTPPPCFRRYCPIERCANA